MNEVWKDVVGYEGVYQVSNTGLVKSNSWGKSSTGKIINRPGRIIKPDVTDRGYCRVTLCGNGTKTRFLVHRIVARSFMGEAPEGTEINHMDGNPSNNCVGNLEYVTKSENSIHAHRILGKQMGEENPNGKLTEDEVREIRKLYLETGKFTSVAGMFGVTPETVANIIKRKTWGWLE